MRCGAGVALVRFVVMARRESLFYFELSLGFWPPILHRSNREWSYQSCCAVGVKESSEHPGGEGGERICSFIPVLVLNFENHVMQEPALKKAFYDSSMAWTRIWEGGHEIG